MAYGIVNVPGVTIEPMKGATESSDGESGLVPQPKYESLDYMLYLKGDGTWKMPRYLTSLQWENPTDNELTISARVVESDDSPEHFKQSELKTESLPIASSSTPGILPKAPSDSPSPETTFYSANGQWTNLLSTYQYSLLAYSNINIWTGQETVYDYGTIYLRDMPNELGGLLNSGIDSIFLLISYRSSNDDSSSNTTSGNSSNNNLTSNVAIVPFKYWNDRYVATMIPSCLRTATPGITFTVYNDNINSQVELRVGIDPDCGITDITVYSVALLSPIDIEILTQIAPFNP